MKKVLSSLLTINKTLYFNGQISDLIEGLNTFNTEEHYVVEQSGYYDICTSFSVGTMNYPGAIRLHIEYKTIDEFKQEINISTSIRVENWIIILVVAGIATTLIIKGKPLAEFLAPVCISSVLLVVVNFVIKVQENLLLDKVIKRLKLKQIK